MNRSEKKAVCRLIQHMQQLQRRVATPTNDDASDEEVKNLFAILWERTPHANNPLPRKSKVEKLVGIMRGMNGGYYAYISRQDVARIIRELAKTADMGSPMHVHLNRDCNDMTDVELYEDGRWNYKETSLVNLLLSPMMTEIY